MPYDADDSLGRQWEIYDGESARPREGGFQRWVRMHFWVTVMAFFAWEIGTLVILKVAPGWFPVRYPKHGMYAGPSHGFIVMRAIILIPGELVCTGFGYLRGDYIARFLAIGVGLGLLISFGVVAPLAGTPGQHPQTTDILIMVWIALGHLAYGALGHFREY